jgi:hypothetical protein
MAGLRKDITAEINRNGKCHLVSRSGMTYGVCMPCFMNLESIEMIGYNC